MTKRIRRRAVGPAGAAPVTGEPAAVDLGLEEADRDGRDEAERERADDERLRRDRPPHHDQER